MGPGVIADRLQSHPATFNVPPRRELERALKHFRHSLDVSGGKGGAEDKIEAMKSAGIKVCDNPGYMGKTMKELLGK